MIPIYPILIICDCTSSPTVNKQNKISPQYLEKLHQGRPENVTSNTCDLYTKHKKLAHYGL